jgi:hypothetical protein
VPLVTAIVYGFVAGALGVGAMTVSEKMEQAITGRPNSYVPAHTLERLFGLAQKPDGERWWLNHTMHYGQGAGTSIRMRVRSTYDSRLLRAVAGGIRALMSYHGIKGPFASFMFTVIRICMDQTLENWTGDTYSALQDISSADSTLQVLARLRGRGQRTSKSSIFFTRQFMHSPQASSAIVGFELEGPRVVDHHTRHEFRQIVR